MATNNQPEKTSRKRRRLERDRVGNYFADIFDSSDRAKLRVSFKRSWYSPPYTEDGDVDLERVEQELSGELTGGTLVVARYLENGSLGYRTEIPVSSKEELEHLLRTMRRLYVEGLEHDNAVRLAGLEACKAKLTERETKAARPEISFTDRRKRPDRRTRDRRGRQLLGRLWFRRDDRRMEEDRRDGRDRRAA
jgi:hypothetical protein